MPSVQGITFVISLSWVITPPVLTPTCYRCIRCLLLPSHANSLNFLVVYHLFPLRLFLLLLLSSSVVAGTTAIQLHKTVITIQFLFELGLIVSLENDFSAQYSLF